MNEAAGLAFYFDLASPEAYLAAERVIGVLGVPAPWEPVLATQLPGGTSHTGMRCAEEELIYRGEIERRAGEQGLQALRWPAPFPFDSEGAMRVATFAQGIGKVVAYSLAAFRQAFAGGRALSVEENVLIAAAACEMHPAAVSRALARAALGTALRKATAAAAAAGVRSVPAVRVGDDVFHGVDACERAAAAIRAGDRTNDCDDTAPPDGPT